MRRGACARSTDQVDPLCLSGLGSPRWRCSGPVPFTVKLTCAWLRDQRGWRGGQGRTWGSCSLAAALHPRGESSDEQQWGGTATAPGLSEPLKWGGGCPLPRQLQVPFVEELQYSEKAPLGQQLLLSSHHRGHRHVLPCSQPPGSEVQAADPPTRTGRTALQSAAPVRAGGAEASLDDRPGRTWAAAPAHPFPFGNSPAVASFFSTVICSLR